MLGTISFFLIVLLWICFLYLWAWGHIETLSEFFKLLIYFSLMTVVYFISETAFVAVIGIMSLIGAFRDCLLLRNKVLQKGDKGFLVKRLQKALKRAGVYKGDIDGIYGPEVVEAVKEFQKLDNIQIDGIAGVVTMHALGID